MERTHSFGYWLRRRRKALDLTQAELAQRLGQAIQDVEWLVRMAYVLPLHNTEPDKALVRTPARALYHWGVAPCFKRHFCFGCRYSG